MDIGSILLILSLLLLVGLFVARPLFESKPAPGEQASREDHELSSLLAERDRLLNALQELDFDNTLGKIPAEDYPAQRAALLQRGADVLRMLDALQPQPVAGDAEERLEAAIDARRLDADRAPAGVAANGMSAKRARVGQAAQVAEPDDQLEALLANRRRNRVEKSAGFCPKCGGPVQASDRFCPKCGKTLE